MAFFSFKCFVVVTLGVGVVSCQPLDLTPCKQGDNDCITRNSKHAWPIIMAGNPALGVNTSDPIYVESIEGNLSILKFKLYDTNTYGFKNCEIDNVKLDLKKLRLRYNLACSDLKIEGRYYISGKLIAVPVEGNGTFVINSKKYLIGVDSALKEMIGKDGKSYMQVKNFKLTLEAVERVKYDFENLFNGQKDLANAVLTFANKHWKEVANLVEEPVFNGIYKEILSNINKYFKHTPTEQCIVDY